MFTVFRLTVVLVVILIPVVLTLIALVLKDAIEDWKCIKDVGDSLQRCNDCMVVFDEELQECPNCGRDDCLMYPVNEHDVNYGGK